MKRQNPPGPLIMALYRDSVMYIAVILGECYSNCLLVYIFDDLKVFSVINAVVTLTTPVSSEHPVSQATFNLRITDPIL